MTRAVVSFGHRLPAGPQERPDAPLRLRFFLREWALDGPDETAHSAGGSCFA
jgi:hypothetical protein